MKDYIDIKNIPKILWMILALGFVIRIFFSFSTEYSIIHGILSDDSFYYFRIAQNIADGFGSTFDQITITNGYQPLVMIPLITIYMLLSNADILTPIIVSQIFLTIVNLLSAMMTYTLMVKLSKGSKVSAVFSLIVLYLNPIFVAINFKSLETNLYWLFLVWSLLYYIKNFESNLPAKDFILGILIALAALSRLDGGFLMVAFAVYFLLKRGIKLFEKIKRVFFVGFGFSILFVPYMLYNHFTYGNVVPISGQAKIFHNHRAVLENVKSYWSVDFLLYEIKRFFFPVDFNQLLERGFGPLEKILVIVGFVLLGVFLIYLWRIKLLQSVWNKFSNLKFFFLFILLHYSYYTLYFWEYRFYYFLPQILLLSFIIGIFIEELISKFSKNTSSLEFNWNKISVSAFALIILFNLFIGYRQLNAVHGQTLVY
ncbi:MAG: glycosyltransferase family 39 protein, partial [Ignavibacteria bacterium]|nr:glycosyltransferase family 39 protein [Ignavibacteria bacterium]